MWTVDGRAVAAAAKVDLDRWRRELSELMTHIGAIRPGGAALARCRLLVSGLLAGLPRSNCWTLAEHAGQASPKAMQHLLRAAPATTCAATSWSTSAPPAVCSSQTRPGT